MQRIQVLFSVLTVITISFLFTTVVPVQAATTWSASGSLLYYMNGQVAISTSNPLYGRLGIKADKQQDYIDFISTDGSYYRFHNPDNGRLEIGVKDASTGIMHWEVIKIYRNGDIAMGSNDDPMVLNVNGKITTREIIVTNQGWADYVFDDNYKLMPLNEVESYINQNKHLPEVASATEVEQQGISLGDMQKIQMQKIEELTLYTIEQDKKISQLESSVAELKSIVSQLIE